MKHLYKLSLLLLALLLPATALAHDFYVDGIYYNINGNEVSVTYKGTYSSQYSNEYSGYVTIPSTVTYGGNTYSVTKIGYYAFSGCSGLTSIDIPNSVTTIDDGAFSGCSGLTRVTIGNSVTTIGNYAFSGCNSLTSIDIPNSVTSIGEGAFAGCGSLSNIEISNSVISIGEWAFQGTDWYNKQPDGLVYMGQVAYRYKGTIPKNTRIVLKEGTLGIADYSFGYASQEKSIKIPNEHLSVDNLMAEDYSGLISIEIPNTMKVIGNGAFNGCSGLTNIDIPNSVTIIGRSAFWGCSGLASVTIGNSVTTIGEYAFFGCSGLTSIKIPNSVISIGESAFYECSGLTNITIPNSVTSIGKYAFCSCTGLTSVTIPNSVTSIGNEAFYGCSGLTEIYSFALLPATVSSSTFSGCYSATLYVPYNALEKYKAADYWKEFINIESITFEVDSKCYRVMDESSLSVMANNEEATRYSGDVVIPDSVTYAGTTFAVTGIESNAFDGCYELTSITIPNSVETIGEQAFQGCTGLTSVNIGSGVTAIGAKAFNYCNALDTVKCLGTVPPVMASSDCFSTAAYNRATLLVPRQQIEAYQAADYWYKFAHIDGWGSAGRGDIDGDGEVSIRDVTTMIDAILTGEHEDVYFESADLNSNGRLDIGDVTTIIDMLLNGE